MSLTSSSVHVPECVEEALKSETISDYACTKCKRATAATKSQRFTSLPVVLALHVVSAVTRHSMLRCGVLRVLCCDMKWRAQASGARDALPRVYLTVLLLPLLCSAVWYCVPFAQMRTSWVHGSAKITAPVTFPTVRPRDRVARAHVCVLWSSLLFEHHAALSVAARSWPTTVSRRCC
jgi:hypothetical protein